MKRFIFLLLLFMQLTAQAQTMREVFLAMPDSLQALLSKNNRMDMVDFVDSHMKAQVENRLDGTSVLDTLTADYLKMTLTKNTIVEMKLFQKGGQQILMVVHTVGAPVKDSVLKFYTPDWKELEKAPLELPAFSAYEARPKAELTEEQVQLLASLADMQLVEVKLSPSSDEVICQLSTDILNKEDREKVKDLIKPVIIKQ